MKTLYIITFILITIFTTTIKINAQIPNAGFEQWSGNEPTGWFTDNAEGFTFVQPSSNPLSGAFSARLEVKSVQNILMPAVLAAGENGEGFPVNQKHGQLSFYYKFSKTVSTAYLVVSVGFKKGENEIGAGVLAINAPADNYTAVTIPVTYVTDDIPDLATILVELTDQNLNPAASGSYAEIDDLSFNIISDVNDQKETIEDFSLEQNYPNPFNPTTKINYQLEKSGYVTLKVYDIIGNEITTLVNNQQPAGKYSVEFNASNLPSGVSARGGYASGVYFYQLKAGDIVKTRKMTLIK